MTEPEAAPFSAAEREHARLLFENEKQCDDCGGIHGRACPRVKARTIRYDYPMGSQGSTPRVAEYHVEYWEPGSWETEDIIFPEDAYEPNT